MNGCIESAKVQDYLDGALSPERARAFEAHAATCERCGIELTLYRRVFEALEDAPMLEPSPGLTERVLDLVVPARVRRHRRLVALGWGYAAAVAGSVGGLWALASLPLARAGLAALSGAASHRLVSLARFLLEATTWVAVRVADGWSVVSLAGQRLAPVSRGISAVLSEPAVALTLGAAGMACALVLWWMRPRERVGLEEVRHVGVVGF